MRRCEYIHPVFFMLCFGFVVLSFFYFDKPVAYFFQALDLQANLPVITWFTRIGSGPLELMIIFSLAVFFHIFQTNSPFKKRFWFLCFCLIIPNLICLILKMLLGRARPDLLFLDHSYGFYGLHLTQAKYWSFPSGHTTTIISLLYGIHWIFPRYNRLFILIGLLLISTRVLLNYHYLSDVVATAGLTLLELLVMMRIMRHYSWFQFQADQKAV